jgi:hypothetical protein
MRLPSDIVHVISYAVAPYVSISTGWSNEAGENGYSGALSSSIVTQQSCNVVLVNLQRQIFHRNFTTWVHFLQVTNLHCWVPPICCIRFMVSRRSLFLLVHIRRQLLKQPETGSPDLVKQNQNVADFI